MNINIEKQIKEVTKIECYSMKSKVPEAENIKQIVDEYMSQHYMSFVVISIFHLKSFFRVFRKRKKRGFG